MSKCYGAQGNYIVANVYLEKSIEILESISRTDSEHNKSKFLNKAIGDFLVTLSYNYIQLKNYPEAEKQSYKAIALLENTDNNQTTTAAGAHRNAGIANLFFPTNSSSEKLEYYQKSYNSFNKEVFIREKLRSENIELTKLSSFKKQNIADDIELANAYHARGLAQYNMMIFNKDKNTKINSLKDYCKALEIYKAVYTDDFHINIKSTCDNIQITYNRVINYSVKYIKNYQNKTISCEEICNKFTDNRGRHVNCVS